MKWKSILLSAVAVAAGASCAFGQAACLADSKAAGNYSPELLPKDGESMAVLPPNSRGMDERGWTGRQSRADETVKYYVAHTTDYGQLEALLAENGGNEIDSLVVVGPMDKADFKAIWDCAVYGNMLALNLEGAQLENNEVPDRALYDPIQFDAGFWLRMRHIMLPEGITRIGITAFAFNGVENINLPSTVRVIDGNAFGYDHWLNDIALPDNLVGIGDFGFQYCFSLTNPLHFPPAMRWIGACAFERVPITTATFSEGLEMIGPQAFAVTKLERVDLPSTCVNMLEFGNFCNCYDLKEMHLSDDIEYLPFRFAYCCFALENLNIPSKLKCLGSEALFGCPFKSLELPEGLVEIEEHGLYYLDALEEVVLPSTLTDIGNSALEGCNKIKKITCWASTPPACHISSKYPDRTSPFYGLPKNTPIYVPPGTSELYRNAFCWDYFTNFIETDYPAGVEGVAEGKAAEGGPIYDLQGRKAGRLVDGEIYVKYGRKFVYRQ